MPVAYDMEEVDLSLRLHDLGWQIMRSPWLRVFHNTALDHHLNPKITAASITNRALFAYLRYPPHYWGFAIAQCCNRILWLMRHRRFAGILKGLLAIPYTLQQHRSHRQLVSLPTLQSYLHLRQTGLYESFSLDLLSTRSA